MTAQRKKQGSRGVIRLLVEYSPKVAILGTLLAAFSTILFGLSWLNIYAIFETAATPPVNSISIMLTGLSLFLSRRPFRSKRLPLAIATVSLLIAMMKPLLGLAGLMSSFWILTNSTIVCLLAIAAILVSIQKPVAAQVSAVLAILLFGASLLGVVQAAPGSKVAILILYAGGFLVASGVLTRTIYRGPLYRMVSAGSSAKYIFAQAFLVVLLAIGITYLSIRNTIHPYFVPLAVIAILCLIYFVLLKLMPFLSHKQVQPLVPPARRQVINDIEQALADKQFATYYQPQIEFETGRLVGAEALARWIHPENGVVSPADFIPVAEQSGQIIEIGYQVLERACIDAMKWPFFENPNVNLSVNVSPVQLQAPDLLENVQRILGTTGLAPEKLVLELTETALVRRGEPGFDTIWALHNLGISIAVDDFGTGYSCLAYLSDLPVQYLKIDQSFVKKLPDDAPSATIARSIVGLGCGLQIKIVAEGVETARQEEFLKSINCHKAQGYFYSKPMCQQDFLDWASDFEERSAMEKSGRMEGKKIFFA